MKNIKYNDGLCNGGRRPRLYLVKGYEYHKFEGNNIDGICAIASTDYRKNGKWSNTDYDITLAPGVKDIRFLSPLHGVWGSEFKNWGEMASQLGIAVQTIQEIIRKEYPTTAKRLDDLEKFAMDIENSTGELTETVIISFGSPTNRAIREGFWATPKGNVTSTGIKVIVAPSENENGLCWSKPILVEPSNGKILTSYSTPGHHGGYITVEVAVPI